MDKSPLARLPAELRNRIYTLSIPTSSETLADVCTAIWPPPQLFEHSLSLHIFDEGPSTLLQVCRQMRHEARLLLWATVEEVAIEIGYFKWAGPLHRVLPNVFGWDVLEVIQGRKITVWWMDDWNDYVEEPPVYRYLRLDCRGCFPERAGEEGKEEREREMEDLRRREEGKTRLKIAMLRSKVRHEPGEDYCKW